jgi:aryl-alcohol dehydrogenase-like predicted oxidoreductase
MRRRGQLRESFGALSLSLDTADLARIETAAAAFLDSEAHS